MCNDPEVWQWVVLIGGGGAQQARATSTKFAFEQGRDMNMKAACLYMPIQQSTVCYTFAKTCMQRLAVIACVKQIS